MFKVDYDSKIQKISDLFHDLESETGNNQILIYSAIARLADELMTNEYGNMESVLGRFLTHVQASVGLMPSYNLSEAEHHSNALGDLALLKNIMDRDDMDQE